MWCTNGPKSSVTLETADHPHTPWTCTYQVKVGFHVIIPRDTVVIKAETNHTVVERRKGSKGREERATDRIVQNTVKRDRYKRQKDKLCI